MVVFKAITSPPLSLLARLKAYFAHRTRFQPNVHSERKTLTALLPLLLTGLLAGCNQEEVIQEPLAQIVRPVKLFEVKDPRKQQLRRFPGKVTATEEAEISFRIPGLLDRLMVNQGDMVVQGQVLAHLDDRDIRNELQDRQASFELAKVEFDRASSLIRKKVISQADFDTASARLKSAEAALKLARDKLEYTTLKAPFSGRIAQRLAENHQQVQAQQPVLIMQSSDMLDISIQIPESIVSHINSESVEPGYQPMVKFPGAPGKRFPVNYKEHATRVTPGTQSYEVIFTREVPEGLNVLPGMSATIIIDLTQVMDATHQTAFMMVPVSAIARDDNNDRTVIWRYDRASGQIAPVEVTAGRITESGIQILSGITPGDRVVAAGLSQLHDGMQVKPLRKERGL